MSSKTKLQKIIAKKDKTNYLAFFSDLRSAITTKLPIIFLQF